MAVALSAAGQSGIVEKTAGPVNFGCRLWVLGEGMGYYLVKTLVSALVIVVVSEVAKRHSGFAALVASLPLTSLLAFVWLRVDGVAPAKIGELSSDIFWLVLPSLVLFLAFPWLMRRGVDFWWALVLAIALSLAGYYAALVLLKRFGTGG